MKIFEITKTWRGGRKVFYIELHDNEQITDSMLESIGDSTNGGQESGYRMSSKQIKSLPKGENLLPRNRRVQIY